MAAGWFYAHGDEEKGPVSAEELKKLAASNALAPTDLVWQEGMEEWVPATEVPGLFPGAPAGAGAARPRPGGSNPAVWFGLARTWSHSLLLVGLLLALWSRGCDTLNHRNAARLDAKLSLAQHDLADDYQAERDELEEDRQDILDKREARRERAQQAEEDGDDPPLSEEEEQEKVEDEDEELAEIQEKLDDLNDEENDERAERQRGSWRRMQSAARDAGDRTAAWAYWHEMFFLLGTFLLVTGLVGIAYAFAGPQRWLAMILLGIVLLSIYGGGFSVGLGG